MENNQNPFRKFDDESFNRSVQGLLGAPDVVTRPPSTLVAKIACPSAENGVHEVKLAKWGREIRLMTTQNPETGEESDWALHAESSTNYAMELRKDKDGVVYVKVVEQRRPTCTRQPGPVESKRDFPGGYDLINLTRDSLASDAKTSGEAGAQAEFEEETGAKASGFDRRSNGFEEAVYKQRDGEHENTVGVIYNKEPLTDNTPVKTENKGEIIVSYYMPVSEVIRSVQEDRKIFGTPGVVLWSLIFSASNVNLEFDF